MGLQGLGGGAWRILAPEQLDERVGRHDRTTMQPEHREDGARFRARDSDGRPALPDLERSQNPQFHRWKRTHVDHRRWGDSTHGQDRVKPRGTKQRFRRANVRSATVSAPKSLRPDPCSFSVCRTRHNRNQAFSVIHSWVKRCITEN